MRQMQKEDCRKNLLLSQKEIMQDMHDEYEV